MSTAYLVLNLHEGDMVSMVRMFRSRNAANQCLLNMIQFHDSSTSWWKILEIQTDNDNQEGNYDVVLRVSWGSSNRVRFIGMYQPGTVPEGYDGERYFTECVYLE